MSPTVSGLESCTCFGQERPLCFFALQPSRYTTCSEMLRTRLRWLQMTANVRELAIFDFAIEGKVRACNLTRISVRGICHGIQVAARAIGLQRKTQRPIQFEITE